MMYYDKYNFLLRKHNISCHKSMLANILAVKCRLYTSIH